ncbi:MAG TPA: glycosyltransferase family 4 protein [Solimonas sp.]|nr:glycosyltransferase family 4 protein [Solimonas sp.]
MSRPLHFLFAFQNGDFGGTERITLHLIRGLQQAGHRCEVASLMPMGTLRPYLEELDIPWVAWDFRRGRGLPALWGLWRHLRRSRADVLVQIAQRAIATLAIGATPARAKIQQCLHHHAGTHPRSQWQAHYAAVRRVFDRVTFLTEWCRDEAVELAPEISDRSAVLYPPVPLEPPKSAAVQAAARQALGLPANAPIFGALGRQVPVKRFDVVLEVAAAIRARRSDAHFLLVGDGPLHEELKARAAAAGLQDAITWLRWQRDVDTVYRALDVLLFVSDWDAFGMVPCEALAVGTPAVCSVANGGLLEVLDQGGWRAGAEGHDVQRLAARAVALLEPSAAAAAVAQGRGRLESLCSLDGYVDGFLRLLPPGLREAA